MLSPTVAWLVVTADQGNGSSRVLWSALNHAAAATNLSPGSQQRSSTAVQTTRQDLSQSSGASNSGAVGGCERCGSAPRARSGVPSGYRDRGRDSDRVEGLLDDIDERVGVREGGAVTPRQQALQASAHQGPGLYAGAKGLSG